jgi:endonuclease YncB( thermonuclease family)
MGESKLSQGTEWQVDRIEKITDGDTLRVIRSRVERLGDHDFRITDVTSMAIRLVWVDTPERGDHPGWEKARADLEQWIHHAQWGDEHRIRVITYESAGWDRLLGDLLDADGNSASQWLMVERGWPAYVKGK